jgi:hypothetical protein
VQKLITLEVAHPAHSDGRIRGFRFLWAYYVNGYHSDRHCQRCFRGRLATQFSTGAASVAKTVTFEMEHFPYLYVCGVAAGPLSERGARNLHLPLKYLEGHDTEVTTYNGYCFRAHNAAMIAIPALADDWNGLPRQHARCKNFQFAVAMFGHPSTA